jgi:hypothetical protein
MIASLIPPFVVLTNGSPYLLNASGREKDEAFLLGIFSSIPFDWLIRRYVEGTLRQGILNQMPVPLMREKISERVVHISGVLAAKDQRFAKWAKAVRVPVGSVKSDEQRNDMEAELDALVAHLYGLSKEQVEHIFKTFHRGWDYGPRLEKTLEHFDRIESEGS